MFSDSEIRSIIDEELCRSEVRSMIDSQLDDFAQNRKLEKKIKEVTAKILADFFHNLYQRKNFWQNDMTK